MMRRWRRWLSGLGLLVALSAAALPLLPRLSPRVARARAVTALQAARYELGVRRFAAYARRFPRHAAEHEPIHVGDPPALVVEAHRYGVLLRSPALPPAAAAFPDSGHAAAASPAVAIQDGPCWTADDRLVYTVRTGSGAPRLLALHPVSRELVTLDLPQPQHFTLSFAAAARLAGRPDAAAVTALAPDLAGAAAPRLLAVSGDGSWLIFRATPRVAPPYELWRCRPDGSDAHRLARVQHPTATVSFAGDGSRLAWFDGPQVCAAGLADSEATVVQEYDLTAVLQPAAPAWSPDGSKLAYGVGSADSWRVVWCPATSREAPVELDRLNPLEGLEFAGADLLLQAQRELDAERWAVTLRSPQDTFHSRVLVPGGRGATLSPNRRQLAWRTADQVHVLLLATPLGDLATDQQPADKLPERPAASPAPSSPAPDAASPPPPARRT